MNVIVTVIAGHWRCWTNDIGWVFHFGMVSARCCGIYSYCTKPKHL